MEEERVTRERSRAVLRRTRRFGLLAVVAAVLAVCLQACGGSKEDASDTSGGSGSASKSPILVGIEAPIQTSTADFSGGVAGVLAAADTINEQGGINGRPIKVQVCNTQNVANQELTCARKLVSDGVVATIGQQYNIAGPAVESYMAKNHVVDIQYTGPQTDGYTWPNTFPLTWELGSWMPCFSKELANQAGGSRVLAVTTDIPESDAISAWERQFAERQGLTWLPPIKVPLTASDFSSVVAKAAQQKPDWVVLGVVRSQALARAISAAGAPFASCIALGLTQAGGWQGLGASTDKLYIGATFKAFNSTRDAPLLDTFIKSVEAYKKSGKQLAKYADLSPNNLQAQIVNAWLGTWAFAQVARKMKQPITAANVMSALGKAKVSMGGVIPDVDFSQPPQSGGPFKRVWNSDAYLWKYDKDKNEYSQVAPVPETLKGVFG